MKGGVGEQAGYAPSWRMRSIWVQVWVVAFMMIA